MIFNGFAELYDLNIVAFFCSVINHVVVIKVQPDRCMESFGQHWGEFEQIQ